MYRCQRLFLYHLATLELYLEEDEVSGLKFASCGSAGQLDYINDHLHILDYDGNLFDAASLATLAALLTTTVPAKRFELGENYPLPLKDPPISCTSVKFNSVVVIDPSLDEEEIAEARLTVATDKNGDIRAMQKGLNGSFTGEEVKKIIKVSIDNGKENRDLLNKSIGR